MPATNKKNDSAANPDAALKAKLEQQLSLLAADDDLRHQYIQSIKVRSQGCQRCHGADGHSISKNCPNLAGQNPLYLVQQLQHYIDGRRKDFQMQSMIKGISNDDKVAIAIFFSGMQPRPSGSESLELPAKGKMLFDTRCVQCHGVDGHGKDQSPRIAGQQPEYTKMMLQEFLNPNGRRPNTIMTPIATALSDEEIKALAAYIANMD